MPSSETLIKAKNVTVILSLAMSFLLVLYTFYIRLMNSNNLLLILLPSIIILVLIILYRRTSDPTPQAPLFSFPSLSTQTNTRLFSLPSFSSHESRLTNSDISWHEQVDVDRPRLEKDHLRIEWKATSEWGSFGRREALERASTMSEEDEVIKMVVHENPHVDQGNLDDESMEDTWRSIVARGEAKPISLKNSLEKVRDMKESATKKRKVKKKKKEGEPSYEEETSSWKQRDIYEIKQPATPRRKEKKKKEGETSYEQKRNSSYGWRQNDAIMMSDAEIFHLSESLIKSQHNRLKIERQESDQRRLLVV